MIDIISGEVLSPPLRSSDYVFLWLLIETSSFFAKATMLFAELTYTLATEEAERIGVDHVARMTATGTGENSTGEGGVGLQQTHNSIHVCHGTVRFMSSHGDTPVSFCLIDCAHKVPNCSACSRYLLNRCYCTLGHWTLRKVSWHGPASLKHFVSLFELKIKKVIMINMSKDKMIKWK